MHCGCCCCAKGLKTLKENFSSVKRVYYKKIMRIFFPIFKCENTLSSLMETLVRIHHQQTAKQTRYLEIILCEV